MGKESNVAGPDKVRFVNFRIWFRKDFYPDPVRTKFVFSVPGVSRPAFVVTHPWSVDSHETVFRIHDILILIRIRILLFLAVASKMPTKNEFFSFYFFFCLYLTVVGTLTSVLKDNVARH
jgi:hypothetical protein